MWQGQHICGVWMLDFDVISYPRWQLCTHSCGLHAEGGVLAILEVVVVAMLEVVVMAVQGQH